MKSTEKNTEIETKAQIALIDFDNVVPAQKSRTEFELEDQIISLKEMLIDSTKVENTLVELDIFIYGGWIDPRGNYTKRHNEIQRKIGHLRTRQRNHRLIPHISLAIQSARNLRLIGTCRFNQDQNGRMSPYQKMVDSMIIVDAIYWSAFGKTVHIFSDDDDIIPGAIEASIRSQPGTHVIFHRSRSEKTGLNIQEITRNSRVLVRKYNMGEDL